MNENENITTTSETEPQTVPEQTVPTAPTPNEVNAANAAASTGAVNDDGQGAAFFSSSDVRAMTREQVRRNLDKILKSMESEEF